jgi:Pro-kumamolisin, activation domain
MRQAVSFLPSEEALTFTPVLGRMSAALRRLIFVVLMVAAWSCAAGGGPFRSGKGASTTNAGGEPIVRLQNNRPKDIDLSLDHGAPRDKMIGLEVEFAVRNKEQFDQLMRDIDDPHSPQYHHWLTPEQMHTKFGESQQQFDAVLQWLQAQGFTITDKSYGTNADYIRFRGSIGQIEKAFDVELVSPEYDQYAARTDPGIPARFDGVVARIAGLEVVGPLY